MLGIGIGLIIGVLLMATANYEKQYTNNQIEQIAKELGMEYPENFKVINKEVK